MRKTLLTVVIIITFFCGSSVCARTLVDDDLEEFMNGQAPEYSDIVHMDNSKIINEFDSIMKEEKESRRILKCTNNEKSEVLKFKEQISNLSNKTEEELEKMNFNERQIKAIKSVEGLESYEISNEVARAASSNFSFNMYSNRFERDYAVFETYWAWESAPIWAGRDTLVFAWSDGFMINENRSTMKITYRDTKGNYKGESRYYPEGLVQGCRFDFEQSYAPGGFRSISNGKAYVVIDNMYNRSVVEIVGEYFHIYKGIVPSLSISKDLGISISPSSHVKSMGRDYLRMD